MIAAPPDGTAVERYAAVCGKFRARSTAGGLRCGELRRLEGPDGRAGNAGDALELVVRGRGLDGLVEVVGLGLLGALGRRRLELLRLQLPLLGRR
jgi:hypothetical protein